MAKQWQASRSDFPHNAEVNKPYNEEKYKQLYDQFERVEKHFESNELIKALSRMIVEEVSNIIEGNETWNTLKVRTEFNDAKTIFKVQIIYDGTEYFDPEKKGISTVMGSATRFKNYSRSHTIEANVVTINVNFQLS